MKIAASLLALSAVSFVGCATETSKPAADGKGYTLRIHQFEGC